ncbi:uncharacterized protein LOC131427867 [Malaya genurostris]|uniref:uncharacterized protein LOC131427867 n=1 Tax=Malaya genurostris TaxID=325434 RepID=UPI0026F3FCF0|nr:uncharacterized protein LOC131427867 [Malaya genurostris]XP_058447404.1 uncharacterized protein LOC131427867 [Malaya genurostris]
MKATLWMWSLVTTLLYVSQQISAEPYTDLRILQPQDNSLVGPAKRTKPSLSIVNPLDVLRQRIILEMARRQMRENTRQVERNKVLLREIGKRSHREFPPNVEESALVSSRTHSNSFPYPHRYELSPERRLDSEDYDLESSAERKATVSRANNHSRSRGSGDDFDEHKSISSTSLSNNDGSGVLTLMQEQRQLEQQQELQGAENALNKDGFHSQELKFSPDNRLLQPIRILNEQRDEDEYYDSNNLLKDTEKSHRRQLQGHQPNDKLKSGDYRLSYLFNIQDKLFG